MTSTVTTDYSSNIEIPKAHTARRNLSFKLHLSNALLTKNKTIYDDEGEVSKEPTLKRNDVPKEEKEEEFKGFLLSKTKSINVAKSNGTNKPIFGRLFMSNGT